MIASGLNLMIYGMGTVFVFLTLLVLVTMTMSSLVLKFFPEEPEPEVVKQPVSAADPRLVAIIQDAIKQHRQR